ncbi:MAG: hypothetical protein ISN64_00205 [Rickettsia sp.]|nr:hypothetical protein [Rickettsia sp.]
MKKIKILVKSIFILFISYLAFFFYIFSIYKNQIEKISDSPQDISISLKFQKSIIPVFCIKNINIGQEFLLKDIVFEFNMSPFAFLNSSQVKFFKISEILIKDNIDQFFLEHQIFPKIYYFFNKLNFLQNVPIHVTNIEKISNSSDINNKKLNIIQDLQIIKNKNETLSFISLQKDFYFKLELSKNPQNEEITSYLTLQLEENLIQIKEKFDLEKFLEGQAYIKTNYEEFFKKLLLPTEINLAKYFDTKNKISINFDINFTNGEIFLTNIKGKSEKLAFQGKFFPNKENIEENSLSLIFTEIPCIITEKPDLSVSRKNDQNNNLLNCLAAYLFQHKRIFSISSKLPDFELEEGIIVNNAIFYKKIKDKKSQMEFTAELNGKNKIKIDFDKENSENFFMNGNLYIAGLDIFTANKFLQKFFIYSNPLELYLKLPNIVNNKKEEQFLLSGKLSLDRNIIDMQYFQINTPQNIMRGNFFITDNNNLIADTKIFSLLPHQSQDDLTQNILYTYLPYINRIRKTKTDYTPYKLFHHNLDINYLQQEENKILQKINFDIQMSEEIFSIKNIFSTFNDNTKFEKSEMKFSVLQDILMLNLNFSQISYQSFNQILTYLISNLDLKDFNFQLDCKKFLLLENNNISKEISLLGKISKGKIFLHNLILDNNHQINQLLLDQEKNEISGHLFFDNYDLSKSNILQNLEIDQKIVGNIVLKGNFLHKIDHNMKITNSYYNLELLAEKISILLNLENIFKQYFEHIKTNTDLEKTVISEFEANLSLKDSILELRNISCKIYNMKVTSELLSINLNQSSVQGKIIISDELIKDKKFNVSGTIKDPILSIESL